MASRARFETDEAKIDIPATTNAVDAAPANDRAISPGSIPPKRTRRPRTGTPTARKTIECRSLAASLPRTISEPVSSLARR